MNRQEEYWALVAQLSREPEGLNTAVTRAVKRAKARRWKRPLSALGGLAGVCAAFVVLVNASPAFALSCARVPVLRELAAAVAWSPSLRAAVEHDYVQYVGQSQTVDGVTLHLEYLIADEQQMVVFYRLENGPEESGATCTLKTDGGGELSGYGVTSSYSREELRSFQIHFTGLTPPDRLTFEITLLTHGESDGALPSAPFVFRLQLDPEKTARAMTLPVEQWIELDGQRLFVDRLELTPTQTALYLDGGSANTAWLESLDFYFTDQRGVRYGLTDSSVSAVGRPDSEGFYTYYCQSLYFLDQLGGLTLHIAAATWLDKETHTIQVDLSTGQADWLPDYISELAVTEENDSDVGLQKNLWISSTSQRMCLKDTYYDPEGGEHSFSGGGYSRAYTDSQGVYHPYRFNYMLKDYPYDCVTLELSYTHVTQLDAPVSIVISP